jgi:hypothetical protein
MDSDVDFIFDVKMRIICIISVANVIQEHSFRIFEVILNIVMRIISESPDCSRRLPLKLPHKSRGPVHQQVVVVICISILLFVLLHRNRLLVFCSQLPPLMTLMLGALPFRDTSFTMPRPLQPRTLEAHGTPHRWQVAFDASIQRVTCDVTYEQAPKSAVLQASRRSPLPVHIKPTRHVAALCHARCRRQRRQRISSICCVVTGIFNLRLFSLVLIVIFVTGFLFFQVICRSFSSQHGWCFNPHIAHHRSFVPPARQLIPTLIRRRYPMDQLESQERPV